MLASDLIQGYLSQFIARQMGEGRERGKWGGEGEKEKEGERKGPKERG